MGLCVGIFLDVKLSFKCLSVFFTAKKVNFMLVMILTPFTYWKPTIVTYI